MWDGVYPHSIHGWHCVGRLPCLAGGLRQQEPPEAQHSLIQSPAPGIADCRGCTSVGKNSGPWPVTNQIWVSPVYLCQEGSAHYCCTSKRADSRLKEVSVPSGEREEYFKCCFQLCGMLGDSSREAGPAEFCKITVEAEAWGARSVLRVGSIWGREGASYRCLQLHNNFIKQDRRHFFNVSSKKKKKGQWTQVKTYEILILGNFHTEGGWTLVQEPRETAKALWRWSKHNWVRPWQTRNFWSCL